MCSVLLEPLLDDYRASYKSQRSFYYFNLTACTVVSILQSFVQVRAGVEVVNSTFREVDSIVKDASNVVESASQYAMQLQNRSRQLKYQASVDEERSLMIANVRKWCVVCAYWYV